MTPNRGVSTPPLAAGRMNGPIGDQKVLVISTYKTVNTLPISYFALSVGAPASTVSDASALSLGATLPYVHGLP